MLNYLEFFEKYPKKILYNLIKYKVVDSTIAKKYNDVFEKYSFTTILSYRNVFEENFEKKEKYGPKKMDPCIAGAAGNS